MRKTRTLLWGALEAHSIVAVVVFELCLGTPLSAQSTFGAIVGSVTDTSGAVVPAAAVRSRNTGENTVRATVSNESGLYELLNLKPGTYELTVSKTGFAARIITAIPLEARQTLRADAGLEVAAGREQVTVMDTVTAINTENGTIADSKSFEQITQLPVNYRGATTSPLLAILTAPGVEQDVNGSVSIGGGLPAQVEYSLDGISTVNVRSNGPNRDMYPSSEMLSEFKVTQANNNAEFGQMGDVTVTTKGGGNSIHGSAFWYHQNAALDAAFYNSPTKQAKVFNTFGGSFSGPVYLPKLYHGRNRTFFFADYEGNRRPLSSFQQYSVPTAAMRAGNLAGVPGAAATDPTNGLPFPNNVMPPARISPVAKSFFDNYYPLPNFDAGSTVTNLRRLAPFNASTDLFDVRIDHVINPSQQIFGRFSWKDLPTISQSLLAPDNFTLASRNLALSHAYTITPRLYNEFRAGISFSTLLDRFALESRNVVATLGLQGLDLSHTPEGSGGFPSFNFSDGTGFSTASHARAGTTLSSNYQFSDNLSWIRGRHTMKFGLDIRALAYQDPGNFGSLDIAQFTFSANAFSGNAFADFLLGLPASSLLLNLGPGFNENVKHYQFYAQDEWRIGDRFTFHYGLRYQIHPPMQEASGNITNFDRTNGNVVIPDHSLPPAPGFLNGSNACPGTNPAIPCTHVQTASQAGLPQGLRYTYYGNWTPRISLAWRPFGNNRTVVRGGFGIFTETVLGSTAFAFVGVHTSDIRTYTNFQGKGKPPLYMFPQTSAGAFALDPVGTEDFGVSSDFHYKDPRSYQWNLTLERDVGAGALLRLTYLGSHSIGLNLTDDLNQVPASTIPYSASRKPYPQWAHLLSLDNIGFAGYHSLQAEASRRYRGGAFFQASYILSKNAGNAGSTNGGPSNTGLALESPGQIISDRFNTRLDRGNLGGTREHRFLFTGMYELPFGRNRRFLKNRAGNAVFGGWNLSTIALVQSGQWQTPTISASLDRSNTNLLGRGVMARPDRIGNGNLADRTRDRWYDITAFTAAPVGSGRFGNSGVGMLEGPGTVAVGGGLAKQFPIAEKLRVRVEATFRNIANHPNMLPPAVNVSNASTFGKLVSAQGQENSGNRSGQIAARLDW